MMQTVRALLHEWMQLLYWVFFKPTALRAHVNTMLPDIASEPASLGEMRRLWHDTPQLRQFVFKTVLFTVLTWLVGAVLAIQLGLVFGFTFNLIKSLVFCFDIPLVRMWVQQKKSSARLLLERDSSTRHGLKE